MLLRPEYTYLFIDFETTWLDIVKDDPIQIGIVLIDHEGTILKKFSSPLRPSKPISELKSIVTYLTQTSLEQLQDAPTLDEILSEITHFLWENTVLIWHNISFDLTFLQRYIDRTPLYIIDTFPLCKACLHFLPSYALEVIAKHLNIAAENAHDALADCLMNIDVFLHCMRHLQEIRSTYLIFDYILQNSQTALASIIGRTAKSYDFWQKTLFLPPLVKPAQWAKKLIQPDQEMLTTEAFWKASQYYVGNTTLQKFLTQIQRDKASRILCFSHKSKVHIADHILTGQWVATSLMHDAIVFLPERIDLLLHKWSFDEGELLFLAKYLSHHLQSHTLIDINSSDDYKIFTALTSQKPPRAWQVTLATHEQLYRSTQPLSPTTQVLFFDVDRRRQTRGNQSNEPLDPHHLLQHLEHASYKALLIKNTTLAKQLEKLTTELHLLFGIIGGEIDHLFIGYPSPTLEIQNISTHTRLPKSKKILENFFQEAITHQIDDEEISHRRKQQYERISELFHHTVIVTKIMYQGDKWWYTFAPPQGFHTFDEMRDHLPKATYSFLSSLNSQATPLGQTVNLPALPIQHAIHAPAQFLQFLEQTTQNMFVLSGSKSHGQDLFQQLIRAKKDQQRLIVGENITWWVGKIVYLATQSKKPVIMIGWFWCYLAARAKKFAISTLIAYHCEGKQKALLLADIQFYRSSL